MKAKSHKFLRSYYVLASEILLEAAFARLKALLKGTKRQQDDADSCRVSRLDSKSKQCLCYDELVGLCIQIFAMLEVRLMFSANLSSG